MDISTVVVAAALQGMDILTGVTVLNRDCSLRPQVGPPDRSAASTTADAGPTLATTTAAPGARAQAEACTRADVNGYMQLATAGHRLRLRLL